MAGVTGHSQYTAETPLPARARALTLARKSLGGVSTYRGGPMPVSRRSKPMLVGESNPYGGDPQFALYPSPSGCSGHRLCCLILGMRRKAYLEAFYRVNLCDGPWSDRLGMEQAISLLGHGGRFILCGARVCHAFGVSFQPFTVVDEVLLRLPHPSGLCRMWNEPGAVECARRAVAAFAPEVAHLLGAVDGEGAE